MPAVAVAPAHRRHDISDRVWEILEPLLPGGKGKTGRRPKITAVSSTPCSGFAHRRPLAGSAPDYGTGRTPTAASAAGGTGTSGPGCWRR